MQFHKTYEFAMTFAYSYMKSDINSFDYDKNNLIYQTIINVLGWSEIDFNNAIISYVDKNWTGFELNLCQQKSLMLNR